MHSLLPRVPPHERPMRLALPLLFSYRLVLKQREKTRYVADSATLGLVRPAAVRFGVVGGLPFLSTAGPACPTADFLASAALFRSPRPRSS